MMTIPSVSDEKLSRVICSAMCEKFLNMGISAEIHNVSVYEDR